MPFLLLVFKPLFTHGFKDLEVACKAVQTICVVWDCTDALSQFFEPPHRADNRKHLWSEIPGQVLFHEMMSLEP